MVQYPEEKSNNPYANWVQPSDPASTSQQAPLSPPPAYTQEPFYTQPDGTHQGYNPQSQSQTYQAPPGPPLSSHDRTGGAYPSYQQDVSGARYPYDQNRAGPSHALHNNLSPYSQTPDAGYQQDVPGVRYPYDQNRAGPSYALHNNLSPYSQTPGVGSTPQDRSPSPNDGNGGLSLASFFGNTGPPPMWQRQPAVNLPYSQFPPMCLISNGNDLGKGFPHVPPPCQVHPHPFSTHDITEEDWIRFLADVKKAASLSGVQRIKSNAIPLVTGVGLLGGLFMTSGIEKRMKAKNRTAAGDVVDHWNNYFFGPRRMEAVLCHGAERLSGRDGAAPLGDASQRRMADGLRRRSSSHSSSSSSSSDSDDNRHGRSSYKFDRRQRRAERREAKSERRREKRARKAERRAGKTRGEYSEPYQIFVQPI